MYAQRATSGRGLFAGLQDVKNYDVDQGWARRHSSTPAGNSSTGSGFLGVLGRWYVCIFYFWLYYVWWMVDANLGE